MKKMKLILEQTFMLSFLIQVVMALESLYSYLVGDPVWYSWYTPISVILVSFLCSIPTLLLLIAYEQPKGGLWRLMPLIHCILLYAFVMGMGYL
ncbi:MAG: hypothetical protein IKS85_06605, partial [Lachnospiraceae bacterium]|nr:hypothetical protein [Lachnospiraceae bacterium]